MDFFTVPTLTFGVLYCFFVISHGRRKILRCNVTRNPSAVWIVQQMREAWPYAKAQKFLLFDRDSKFGNDVISAAKNLGTEPVRTAFRSRWQNGVAERWVGSCRRDLLDHVIVLNERHLKRLMREYIRYYHEDRTHLGLAKDTPDGRAVARDMSFTKSVAVERPLPTLAGSIVSQAAHTFSIRVLNSSVLAPVFCAVTGVTILTPASSAISNRNFMASSFMPITNQAVLWISTG